MGPSFSSPFAGPFFLFDSEVSVLPGLTLGFLFSSLYTLSLDDLLQNHPNTPQSESPAPEFSPESHTSAVIRHFRQKSLM